MHAVSNQRSNLDRTLSKKSTEVLQIVASEVATLKDANLLKLSDVKGIIDIEPALRRGGVVREFYRRESSV